MIHARADSVVTHTRGDIADRLEYEAQNGVFIAADRQADTRDLHRDAAVEIRRLREELSIVRSEWAIASVAESRCHQLREEIERLKNDNRRLLEIIDGLHMWRK